MRLFSTLFMFFMVVAVFAQTPANDDCDGLIDLGLAPTCPDSTFFNNVDATASEAFTNPADNIPACWDNVNRDVWFAFTTNTFTDYTIYLEGITDEDGNDPIQNPQIALYRGDCVEDGLAELLCAESEDGDTTLSFDAIGLTPNTQYFLRVDDFSASATPNSGAFYLCIDSVQVINTIPGESTSCSGELYDSGGPDGDYVENEDGTFTICPNALSNCINFSLEYYNIEAGSADGIFFYDGPEANPGTLIAEIGGNEFFADFGGGGVCYEVQASSGCLTVQFISDGSVNFEGFAGSWECSATPCDEPSVLTVDPNITEQQIVDFISTPQTTVDITNISCEDGFYGTFEADDTDLGLERGLLLTTGSVNNAIGPNTIGSSGFAGLFDGDDDLDSLSVAAGNSLESNDACVVELEVFSATNELTFEYVFGSEEYPEFVNDGFNDIFAFLISGPGIVGEPYLDNQLNIAVLPTDQSAVEIDNVNNINNWQFYRDNTDGQSLQYDGLTSDFFGIKKSLTARAEVVPCSTYQLKLAIADRGDWSYDSGVFISELRGGTPNLDVNFSSGIDYLIEDCTDTPDEILVQLSNALEDTVTYNVVIGGTATLNDDYLLDIPSSVTFLPGQTDFSFPIQPLSDMETEDIETIEISLTNNFGCGDVVYTTLVIELHDELNVLINTGQDSVLVCQDSSVVLTVDGAATYFWAPPGIFEDASASQAVASPQNSLWVEVQGNVGICADVDSVYLELISPEVIIETTDPTTFCRGDSITLEATNNVGNSNLVWTPVDGFEDANSPIIVAEPQNSVTYIAEVEVTGCVARDTIDITVDIFDFPDIIADTLICQNYSVQLGFLPPLDSVSTSYEWTPATGLDDATSAEPIATPDETTTYQLIANSFSEVCADTAEVTVQVFPANVEIQNPDTIFLCKGESVDLTAVTSTGSDENLEWGPFEENLSDSLGFTVNAQPDATVQYFSTFVVGECLVRDSVFVRVDSLPQELNVLPTDTTVCEGSLVALVSDGYDPTLFPNIEFDWSPNLGFETPDSNLTVVISAVETTTYTRYAISGACIDSAAMVMNVDQIPELSLSPADTSICLGETVDLVAEIDLEPDEITWNPPLGLSCNDCLTPTATPQNTTAYTIEVTNGTCSTSASTFITVQDDVPFVSLPGDTVCFNSTVVLNEMPDGSLTYSWSSPDDPGFSSTDPAPIVSPDMTTTYEVVVSNGICPDLVESVTIPVVQQSSVTITQDTIICQGDEVTLSAISTAAPEVFESFTWSENGEFLEEGATINVSPTEDSEYTLTYSYGPGCETITATMMIFVEASASIDELVVSPDDGMMPINIDAGVIDTVTAIISPDDLNVTYSWTIDTVPFGGNTPSINHTVAEEGLVTYTLTITTDTGCETEASVQVNFVEPTIAIPNAFSPDGDGTNDFFYPVSSGSVILIDMKIYNRWGQLVFDNDDLDQGWDGNYNGNPAPSDVYIYKLMYKKVDLPDAAIIEQKGDLTLLR